MRLLRSICQRGALRPSSIVGILVSRNVRTTVTLCTAIAVVAKIIIMIIPRIIDAPGTIIGIVVSAAFARRTVASIGLQLRR